MTDRRSTKKIMLVLTVICGFWLFLRPIIGISQKGSIRIHFNRINPKREAIELSLYDVSAIINDNPTLSQLSQKADSKALLRSVQAEVKRLQLVPFIHTGDENQVVEWQELSKGSYLIVQPKAASFGMMEPILITLPYQDKDSAQMDVVIEPAIIQTTASSKQSVDANVLIYLPDETISLKDVFYLFLVFTAAILISSLWKYQREQREI